MFPVFDPSFLDWSFLAFVAFTLAGLWLVLDFALDALSWARRLRARRGISDTDRLTIAQLDAVRSFFGALGDLDDDSVTIALAHTCRTHPDADPVAVLVTVRVLALHGGCPLCHGVPGGLLGGDPARAGAAGAANGGLSGQWMGV